MPCNPPERRGCKADEFNASAGVEVMTHNPLFLVAINLFVAVLARSLKPNLLTALLLGVVMIASIGYLGSEHGDEILDAVRIGRDRALTWSGYPPTWPPERSRTFPDLTLIDQDGNSTRLSDFKGQVVLLEPVGMSCPACVAFSGGKQKGAFEGVEPQENLESIHHYARNFGRVHMEDPRVVFVQIILFNQDMQAPSLEEVRAWANHFGFRREKNQIVLAGTPEMVTESSRAIVPGFQLIDKNFVLRCDSTGIDPVDDLYHDLLPMMRTLVKK